MNQAIPQILPQVKQSLAASAQLTVEQSRLALDSAQAQLAGVTEFVQDAQSGNGLEGFQKLAKQSADIGAQWFAAAIKLQQDFFSSATAQVTENVQTATAAASKAARGK